MLKNSPRNCKLIRSLGLKVLKIEASISSNPGPVSVFLPRLPKVPLAGFEKAQGSYQCCGVPSGVPGSILLPGHPAETPEVGLLLKPGFKLGRSGFHLSPSKEILEFTIAVIGSPERNVPIPFAVQPPKIAPRTFCWNLNGN